MYICYQNTTNLSVMHYHYMIAIEWFGEYERLNCAQKTTSDFVNWLECEKYGYLGSYPTKKICRYQILCDITPISIVKSLRLNPVPNLMLKESLINFYLNLHKPYTIVVANLNSNYLVTLNK